jgi:hypothetical protein
MIQQSLNPWAGIGLPVQIELLALLVQVGVETLIQVYLYLLAYKYAFILGINVRLNYCALGILFSQKLT